MITEAKWNEKTCDHKAINSGIPFCFKANNIPSISFSKKAFVSTEQNLFSDTAFLNNNLSLGALFEEKLNFSTNAFSADVD